MMTEILYLRNVCSAVKVCVGAGGYGHQHDPPVVLFREGLNTGGSRQVQQGDCMRRVSTQVIQTNLNTFYSRLAKEGKTMIMVGVADRLNTKSVSRHCRHQKGDQAL